MPSNLLINDLIHVTPTQPPLIRLYIQFVADVNTNRALKGDASTYYHRIFNETFHETANTNKAPSCLGLKIRCNLGPTSGLPQGAVNLNFLSERDASARNPFLTPPLPDEIITEKDAFGTDLTGQPTLPKVRFYIGDGESLCTDIVGEGKDPLIDGAQATARMNYNFANNFAGVIPGYEFNYSTRTSFFSREHRAGYLFTDSAEPIQVTFMHELMHVLGLSDRYIEGIDDDAPNHPFRYVGKAARRTPPLSKGHVNFVLTGGLSAPAIDTDYDPQKNLMSSRSYELSTYQRSVITNREIEPTYVNDDVMVLLFDHPACKRTATVYSGVSCRTTETPYRPTAVHRDPSLNKDFVTFEIAPTTPQLAHNAVFKKSGAPLSVRYQSDKDKRQILRRLIRNDGLHCEAVEMMFRYFKF